MEMRHVFKILSGIQLSCDYFICEYTLCIGAASILGNDTLFSWYYLPSSSRVIILSVNTRFAEGHSWKWDTSDKRPLSALMVVWLDGQLGILSQFVFPQNYHFCWMLGESFDILMFKNLTFHIIGQKMTGMLSIGLMFFDVLGSFWTNWKCCSNLFVLLGNLGQSNYKYTFPSTKL